MEKKTISVHAFTVHLYSIAVVVLCLLLLGLGVKYVHLKLAVNHYTQAAIWQQIAQSPTGPISDYAVIVATTVAGYPQDKPLYTQPLQLEGLVTTLSKSLHRDIVVMDTNQKILADTVVGNMGSTYTSDTNKEIAQTIHDGVSRSFTETSVDYPGGLSLVVVPMKNDKGQVIGAVLVSNASVSK